MCFNHSEALTHTHTHGLQSAPLQPEVMFSTNHIHVGQSTAAVAHGKCSFLIVAQFCYFIIHVIITSVNVFLITFIFTDFLICAFILLIF